MTLVGTGDLSGWLVKGPTVLIPMDGSQGESDKFRYNFKSICSRSLCVPVCVAMLLIVPLSPNPHLCRPITCLNIIYKIYTGMLTGWLEAHVTGCRLSPDEEKDL